MSLTFSCMEFHDSSFNIAAIAGTLAVLEIVSYTAKGIHYHFFIKRSGSHLAVQYFGKRFKLPYPIDQMVMAREIDERGRISRTFGEGSADSYIRDIIGE